jgi:hypothetical protein
MKSRTKSLLIAVVSLLLCEVVFCQGFRVNTKKVSAPNNTPQTGSALSTLIEGVRRAQLASRSVRNYELVREYRISGDGHNSIQADVTAALDFSPGKNTYTIEKHDGSPRGTDVVRRILDHEVESSSAKSKADSSVALTTANYDFSYGGETSLDGKQCFLLGLIPKRKDKELIAGQAWIDKSTFEVRRIEGDLAKSPSMWIKKVHVAIAFGDVGGNWLQTSLDAKADVRFIGTQTLTSNLVDFQTPEEVAQKSFGTAHAPGSSAFRQRQ